MAIVFELWAECHAEDDRDALVEHVDGWEIVLATSGRTVRWDARPEPEPEFALTATAAGLSTQGVRTLDDAVEATECGLRIYHRLLTAPDFRFVRAYWDAGTLHSDELHEYVDYEPLGERPRLSLSCVVEDALFRELGEPWSFEPFRDGYWWVRYRGETYRPLGSNDRPGLGELEQELFPRRLTWRA